MTSKELKDRLWDAANALRGSVSAAQYKYPVLGLVFLKYISDTFEAQGDVIRGKLADPASDIFIDDDTLREESAAMFVEDKTFYESDNVFWVPEEARFQKLLDYSAQPDLPQKLDEAMRMIEKENTTLTGVLYRNYGRLELEAGKLGELMGIVAQLKFDPRNHGSRDVFGEVYEYFLGKFARMEGQRAGEFYTPKCVVETLVEVLAPFRGKIYDPACGSGGMFVQSAKFMEAHAGTLGKKGDLAIYGQELMAETRKLCKMNLAIHGLEGNIGKTYASTFTNDQHPTLRADFLLANPPFNISNWGGEKLEEDPRWAYGIPPKGNANFAWLQHMLARLSHKGRAGVVLANGSMSSQQSGEGAIREGMIKDDVVECMVALPGQLFSTAAIPVCLWFLSKDKKPGINGKADRSGQILFIDCRQMGTLIPGSRIQKELSEEEIQKIAQTYHRWRETDFSDGEDYQDEAGFCASVDLVGVEKHGFVLTPGRYVGANGIEADSVPFEEKMTELSSRLYVQMKETSMLDDVIRKNMEVLGYGE
ncbi:MAG: type I restriction-modification system subunit M [Candidatus Cloacimonetes bacterium]|nr:type I restriction-modification system subunit M [Candidatus Cloacimonadota bacterium]